MTVAPSDSIHSSDIQDSSLQSILSSLYDLVDLSEPEFSDTELEVDFARRYIKDLTFSCPN